MTNKENGIRIVNNVINVGHYKIKDIQDYLNNVEEVTYLYDKNSKKEEHVKIMIEDGYSVKSEGKKLIYRDYSKPVDMFSKFKGYGISLIYVKFEKGLGECDEIQ